MQITANGKRLPILSRQMLLVLESVAGRFTDASKKQICMSAKLLIIFTLATCLYANAGVTAQTVTLKTHQSSLEKVMREVRKQTGYDFVFNNNVLVAAKPVTIDANKMELVEFLKQCLKDQPLQFEILGNKTIVIREKKSERITEGLNPRLESAPPPANIDVTVTVIGADNNQTLEGASVMIKGSNKGVVTDVNGRAILKDVEPNATIVISFTGYASQEVKLSSKVINPASLVVKLNANANELEEVVVNKGSYTEKQKYSVSTVGHIDAKQIEKAPVQNPLLAIQGLIPGVEITQQNGLPGGAVKVRIQGINTLRFNDVNSPTDPLIVIDGVPYPSNLMSTINLENIVQGGNPLNYINPADIESIDILKDADATAIYGSRAANGAILITTKKGKAGNSKLSVNLQQGWGRVTRHVDMMNTRQYLDMRYEAFRNDNLVPSSNPNPPSGSNLLYAPDLTIWDTTRYTDWQKVLIGGTAQYTNMNASFSGGTAGLTYLVGGTYNLQTTVFPGDFNDAKGSLHFNLNSVSLNQKLRLLLTGSYMVDANHLSNIDLTTQALFTEPNAPALYNSDGSLNWAPNSAGTSTWTNPLDYLLAIDFKNTTKNLVSSANLSYKIWKGFEISSNFGYTDLRTNIYIPNRLEAAAPETRYRQQRSAAFGNRTMNSWIVEPQISYKTSSGKWKLDALLGSTIQKNNSDMLAVSGTGFVNDLLMKSLANASSVSNIGNTSSEYKYNALFGRLNYNWDDKYVINLTARRDGSSRFGDNNKFHNFWSAGIGWLFSNDKWIKKNVSFLSFGKIRGSYGTTGNDQIADYSYLSLYSTISGVLPYQNLPSVYNSNIPNPNLAWEETKKLQGGIDLGFFKDRIVINATYVYNRSSNQLINYNVPSITGFTSIAKNFPATIQNTAWELELNTTNIKGRQLTWRTSLNFTLPQNKLASFPNIELTSYGSSTSTVIVGKPLGLVRVYPFAGIDPSTGIYMVYKYNGTLTSSPSFATDKTVLVRPGSKYYGGIQNSISFKGVQLDFLFQFVRQLGQMPLFYYGRAIPGGFSSGISNQPVTILNHWKNPGDNNQIGRYGTSLSASAISGSDALYSYDASYIRLKNVSLSWQLPATWLRRVKMQNIRLYFRGENLATISKFTGLDPETQSISSLPPLQVWTLGAQLEF
jgi:TonB-linked SusC/RagA family outer membrane protein